VRRLVYYVAVTLDGFIARPDGSFDCFLFEGEHFCDLIERFPETFPTHYRSEAGITGEARCFDTVLMGRHTYEVGLREGLTSPYAHLRQYLVSTTLRESPDPAVRLHRGDPLDLVRRLKAENAIQSKSAAAVSEAPPAPNDIWLCGGAKLAAVLASEIDELILKINPVVIGKGIPLFDGLPMTRSAEMLEHTAYANGFVLARYRLL
jgi:dihydrofolate reductase